MWTPRHYKQEDVSALHDLIRTYPFGILVSAGNDGLVASHLPFLLIEGSGEFGILETHVARANPHWKNLSGTNEVMVIFRGPHAYISPGWYENKVNVPTWNYAALHAYGKPEIIHDEAVLRKMVSRLTDIYEPPTSERWSISTAEPIMPTELKAITGIRIPVNRWVGKFKFNQHHSADDQMGVVNALSKSDREEERAVAQIMYENVLAKESR